MAIIHQAQLVPSKLEALAAWLPGQPWAAGAAGLTQVGAYRFDDPDGVVGIETLLLRAEDGRLLQVPLTYRAAPLARAQAALVATLSHSVLGDRWAYDGCADPVAVRALLAAIRTGGHEAEMELHTRAGTIERREPTARVLGSGTPGATVPPVDAVRPVSTATTTELRTGDLVLTVRRVLDDAPAAPGEQTLHGTWTGTTAPVLLASVRDGS